MNLKADHTFSILFEKEFKDFDYEFNHQLIDLVLKRYNSILPDKFKLESLFDYSRYSKIKELREFAKHSGDSPLKAKKSALNGLSNNFLIIYNSKSTDEMREKDAYFYNFKGSSRDIIYIIMDAIKEYISFHSNTKLPEFYKVESKDCDVDFFKEDEIKTSKHIKALNSVNSFRISSNRKYNDSREDKYFQKNGKRPISGFESTKSRKVSDINNYDNTYRIPTSSYDNKTQRENELLSGIIQGRRQPRSSDSSAQRYIRYQERSPEISNIPLSKEYRIKSYDMKNTNRNDKHLENSYDQPKIPSLRDKNMQSNKTIEGIKYKLNDLNVISMNSNNTKARGSKLNNYSKTKIKNHSKPGTTKMRNYQFQLKDSNVEKMKKNTDLKPLTYNIRNRKIDKDFNKFELNVDKDLDENEEDINITINPERISPINVNDENFDKIRVSKNFPNDMKNEENITRFDDQNDQYRLSASKNIINEMVDEENIIRAGDKSDKYKLSSDMVELDKTRDQFAHGLENENDEILISSESYTTKYIDYPNKNINGTKIDISDSLSEKLNELRGPRKKLIKKFNFPAFTESLG